MVVRAFRLLIIALQLGFLACASETGGRVAMYEGGFASVVHDEQTDTYLVSNISREGYEADDNGLISRRSHIVADITVVRKFDFDSPLVFLNNVVVLADSRE